MGVLQTTLLLICSSRLARWLIGIGLVLTAIGLVVMDSGNGSAALPLFVVALIVGMPAVVISPVLLGPVLFRSLASPRAIGLIPASRLKLALGALTTQLLLSLFISAVVTAMLAHPFVSHAATMVRAPARLATVFVIAFGALSLQFLGYYWSSQYRFGGLWLLGVAQLAWLVNRGPQEWHLGNPFATPAGLAATLAVSMLAWVGFMFAFVRASCIRPPHVNNSAMQWRASSRAAFRAREPGAVGPATYTRSEAVALLLSGFPRYRLSPFAGAVLILMLLLVIMALATGIHAFSANWLGWGAVCCPLAGPVAWGNASRLAARSRLLWMTSGLERAELFRQIEMKTWWLISGFFALGVMFVASGYGLNGSSGHIAAPGLPPTWVIAVLVTPLVCGATCLYSGMQFVRGRRPLDLLLLAAALLLWFLDVICAMAGVAMQTISTLLAIQIILVAPLRALALRRWQYIDWVIYRPLRSATGVR